MLCLRLFWCPEIVNSRPKLLQILLLLLLLQRALSPRLAVPGRRESGNWWQKILTVGFAGTDMGRELVVAGSSIDPDRWFWWSKIWRSRSSGKWVGWLVVAALCTNLDRWIFKGGVREWDIVGGGRTLHRSWPLDSAAKRSPGGVVRQWEMGWWWQGKLHRSWPLDLSLKT